jgi:hypothetical protein
MSQQGPFLPPPSPGSSVGPGRQGRGQRLPRWVICVVAGVVIGVLVGVVLLPSFLSGDDRESIEYSELRQLVADDQVQSIEWDNENGSISGTLDDGTEFSSNGPIAPSDEDMDLLHEHNVDVEFHTRR